MEQQEINRPEMKKVDGYLGQRFQILGFNSVSNAPEVLGWSEDKTGGSIKFKADLDPLYTQCLLIDLQKNPRALANGYYVYEDGKNKTTRYEVLDYGKLKYKGMGSHMVICSMLPPPLAEKELVEDYIANPRTVIFERKDFFLSMKGIG